MDDLEDDATDRERLARQRALGAELRKVFGRVEDEPVPKALRELAARLDERLARQDATAGSPALEPTKKIDEGDAS